MLTAERTVCLDHPAVPPWERDRYLHEQGCHIRAQAGAVARRYALTVQDAENLAQDACVRLLEMMRRGRRHFDPAHPQAEHRLNRLLRNLAVEMTRRRKVRQALSLNVLIDDEGHYAQPAQTKHGHEEQARLQDCREVMRRELANFPDAGVNAVFGIDTNRVVLEAILDGREPPWPAGILRNTKATIKHRAILAGRSYLLEQGLIEE